MAVLMLAAALLVPGACGGGDEGGPQSFGGGVKITFPDNWERIADQELALVEGRPLGGVRRKDGQGIVTFRRQDAVERDPAAFAIGIDRELRRRFPDIGEIATRTVRTKAGEGYLASFPLSETGTVQTIVVIPQGSTSFRIEAATPAAARSSAREIGDIIRSFDA